MKRLQSKLWTRNEKFLVLSVVPVYFLIAGLIAEPFESIVNGFVRIIEGPDFLITDYMEAGGIGACLSIAAVLMLASILILYAFELEIGSHTITASFLMFGFSLFGKTMIYIWPILAGVCLYAKYHRTSVARYLGIGFYGASLSPLLAQFARFGRFAPETRLGISMVLGVAVGFVLPPLATHTYASHKGCLLYNVGFAGGIIALVAVTILRSFGLEIGSGYLWHTGSSRPLLMIVAVLFGGMCLGALAAGRKGVWAAYRRILRSSGNAASNYPAEAGLAATYFNMGVNGLAATLFVTAVGGDINGPTVGCIMIIAGFGAAGQHLRNLLPVMLGAYLTSVTGMWEIKEPPAMLALLCSASLAPVTGKLGIGAGVAAGCLYATVICNGSMAHMGMDVYSHGLAGGLVVMFLVPVFQAIRDRRARARGRLSL